VHKVSSSDVNDYLCQIAGTHVTAKDFRTWHGSVMALEFTRTACAGESPRGAATQVIAQVAARLGNTVAVCRKSYIHPKVLELGALLGDDDARSALLEQRWAQAAAKAGGKSLSAAERRLMALLGPLAPRRSSRRKPVPPLGPDGSGICQTPADRPVASAPRRKATHAKDLGFHDAQRAGRPSRREPAARRAGDG
jgi:DNA topoisomerase IB